MSFPNYIPALVRDIPEDVDDTRTIEFVISDNTRDRHRTVCNPDGWELSRYNGIVGYQHNVYGDNLCESPNPDDIIGKSTVFTEGGLLVGRVTFEPEDINPLAEKIFKKVKFGTLNSASVGFLPEGEGKYGEGDEARGAENETYYFKRQELLEWSIVNIPSNPSARVRNFQIDKVLGNIQRFMGRQYTEEELLKLRVEDILNQFRGERTVEPIIEEVIETKNLKSKRKRILELL